MRTTQNRLVECEFVYGKNTNRSRKLSESNPCWNEIERICVNQMLIVISPNLALASQKEKDLETTRREGAKWDADNILYLFHVDIGANGAPHANSIYSALLAIRIPADLASIHISAGSPHPQLSRICPIFMHLNLTTSCTIANSTIRNTITGHKSHAYHSLRFM